MCGCPRDALCPLCYSGAFANLRGTSACRGEVWAQRVARVVDRALPWPPHAGKAAAIARDKVADLTLDPRLLEALAMELARWAARWWRATSHP